MSSVLVLRQLRPLECCMSLIIVFNTHSLSLTLYAEHLTNQTAKLEPTFKLQIFFLRDNLNGTSQIVQLRLLTLQRNFTLDVFFFFFISASPTFQTQFLVSMARQGMIGTCFECVTNAVCQQAALHLSFKGMKLLLVKQTGFQECTFCLQAKKEWRSKTSLRIRVSKDLCQKLLKLSCNKSIISYSWTAPSIL